MRTDHPLTLTVEQAGHLLGVGRSTAYELVRSGDLEGLRLRRRVVVPAARIAECLGITLAEVWDALQTHAADAGSSPLPAPVRGKRTPGEPGPPSLF